MIYEPNYSGEKLHHLQLILEIDIFLHPDFYIGNILHGIFDLSLLIIGIVLLSTSEYEGLGALLLVIDAIHTVVVFFRLITEKQKDGYGKIIVLQVYKDSDSE